MHHGHVSSANDDCACEIHESTAVVPVERDRSGNYHTAISAGAVASSLLRRPGKGKGNVKDIQSKLIMQLNQFSLKG